jgi:hypothetical protein
MKEYIVTVVFMLTSMPWVFPQEPLQHEKKIYVSPENRIYINKSQPAYLRIAASPEKDAPSYLLHSEQTAQYTNPMYFDTEGRNTFRSPSAVDTSTRKPVLPAQDIIFEVYADGMSPVSSLQLTGATSFLKQGKQYYGKGLKCSIQAKDEESGVEATYASFNAAVYSDISTLINPFEFEKEYAVKYYSVDHVGNIENPRSVVFQTDYAAPVTSFKIIGESKGNVLSSKASISLSSTDNLSGVRQINYSINNGPEKLYISPIPLTVLKEGDSKIAYYAMDNVGNIEEAKTISASTGKNENSSAENTDENGGSSAFSFYIDNEPPVVSYEIVGDQFKGSYLFIASSSRFKINATDEKSGVDKILYSINNGLLNNTYTEPLQLKGTGLQSIYFASSDYVGNFALSRSQQVFVDNSKPVTKISFQGPLFRNRDTLFVTKDTRIALAATDDGSGVKQTSYSIGNKTEASYMNPISVEAEGSYTIEYNTSDNVNNMEEQKTCTFFVDNTPPKILYNYSVIAIGEKRVRDENYTIYPSNAMLYIAATDSASGGETIEYRINGSKQALHEIPVKGFLPGNYEVEITARDVLKNAMVQVIRFSIEN